MTGPGIDAKAFRALSCGLYIVSAKDGEASAGCIVNTLLQVTSAPARVTIAINKENFTTGVILKSKRFEAVVLAEDAPMELIGRFGFQTSADADKFAETAHAFDHEGTPYVTEHAVARFGARVIDAVDVGTHYVIVGEVDCAETLSDAQPMTYAYYHQVKGGKTPPKASSYDPAGQTAGAPEAAQAEDAAAPRYGWRCMMCGYVIEIDELPEGFTCPVCGVGRDMFERIEL